ncbi:MAG: mevalonate kinase family protein [Candidatus Methanofastidiosia archaeon]
MKKITCSAPARVDLSGGAADIFGLTTLSVAIDLRAKCTLSKSKGGIFFNIGKEKIKKEYATSPDYDILNSIIKRFNLKEDIELTVSTEIPKASGLGGSASIAVSTICALNNYFSMGLNKYLIAEHAQRIETLGMKLKNGYQDQYTATFGECIFMDFKDKTSREIGGEPYAVVEKLDFPYHLVVANTGIKHNSGNINLRVYEKYASGNMKIINLIKRLDTLTRDLRMALIDSDFESICKIVNENQEIIRKFKRSLPENEILIAEAMRAGANAAKVTGAGCGGSIAALCKSKGQTKKVANHLKKFSEFVSCCSVAEGVKHEL